MDRPIVTRRGRFRYSLRALLAAITVVAVWLGWNANFVLERDRLLGSKEFLLTLEPRGTDPRDMAKATRLAGQGYILAGSSQMIPPFYKRRPMGYSLPKSWTLLGAEPLEMDIWLTDDRYSTADAERIHRLFPECQITLIPYELAKRKFLR